jgi:hypothetical protein
LNAFVMSSFYLAPVKTILPLAKIRRTILGLAIL